MAYLMRRGDLQECPCEDGFPQTKDMPNNTYKYLISGMGQWYSVTVKYHGHIIELWDSLKLLPFSVADMGESFKTKHRKLEMTYEGYRYAGCEITDEEQKYIANDVLVVKEALEFMFDQGHTKMTIGSCCLAEYRKDLGVPAEYKSMFPQLSDIQIDKELYGADTADRYIRRSYHGGWCYVVKGKEGKTYEGTEGFTADVNSLYPSMMSSQSGNAYPVGYPTFVSWSDPFHEEWFLDNPDYYYFIRIRTRFYIKKDRLPCIQIKNNLMYNPREWLETSDIYNPQTGKYCDSYIGLDGFVHPATVELTLTKTDYELVQEQYDLKDTEILDACYFHTEVGIFDRYIDKYRKIKQESKGAMRQLAKLFLNNLYGKLATSTNSSYKRMYVGDDDVVHANTVLEFKKKAVFIACGSAITSYARAFTIRSAQANYYGKDKRGFIYADTDSIHCDLPLGQVRGIRIHPTDFCAWKIENEWDTAIYTRQKTYIERVTKEDGEPVEPYWQVKCAGMPKRCKALFIASMTGDTKPLKKMTETEKQFVSKRRTIKDFKVGLCVPSKLLPKRINGGIVLTSTTFEMR